MEESLVPVVYWFTRGIEADYETCLMEHVIKPLRPAARHYISRYLGCEGEAHSPDGMIFDALASHQRTLLKPYVPRLRPKLLTNSDKERQRTQAVVCAWPEWTETGMVVELAGGQVHRLKPPLPEDGQTVQCELAGQTYEFKFYRTDEMEQRLRWFRYVLRDRMAGLRASAHVGREVPTDPSDIEMTQAGFQQDYLFTIFRKSVDALLDKEDLDVLASPRSNAPGKERTRLYRARHLMAVAAMVLREARWSPAAQSCLSKLRAVGDGRRGTILSRYAQTHDLWEQIPEVD